jgi:osmotically inducible protein OsmC
MPIANREAEIVWEGPLARGTGTLTSGSGALDQRAVTWASRTERPDGKTSPEELIAAAHASCFAMAVALVLGENKTPPERVAVSAACTLGEVEGVPRITTVELTVRVQVPGLEAAVLKGIVGRAADLCPVSNALRGNVKVFVRSDLAPSVETTHEPGENTPPARSSTPWPHSRREAEVERIVRALRGYGVLTRARLLDVSGAAHWSDAGARRALADAVSSGRIRQLGDDLYEIATPRSDEADAA